MDNVIPFPRRANTEPIIDADYFGTELIPLQHIFEILDQVKQEAPKDKS